MERKSLKKFKSGELIKPVKGFNVSFGQLKGYNRRFLKSCNEYGTFNKPFMFLETYSESVYWNPERTSYDVFVVFLFRGKKIHIRRIFSKDNYHKFVWRYNESRRLHGKFIWHWTEWFERVK